MRELIDKLNDAQKAYDEGKPYISDKEYDDAYFRLKVLEAKTGPIFADSPTQKVQYLTVSKLEKVKHETAMLSLDKTKSIEEFREYFKGRAYVLSLKLDGLTCRLTYNHGVLVAAETRGDGEEGDNILHAAMVIPSIPKAIPYRGKMVVDGEVICKYNDFKEFAEEYKNPRNFAAGSLRLLDANEIAKRKLTFVAWNMVKGYDAEDSYDLRLGLLMCNNFETVPATCYYGTVDLSEEIIEQFKLKAKNSHLPIDGLVGRFDSISYGKSLGRTGHHYRGAYAFKFYDEEVETKLIDIEWSMGRYGELTPVVIFDSVDLEGTSVSRANVHNLNILEQLSGGQQRVGDRLHIFKANQIIPQVSQWQQGDGELLHYPTECPCCGGPVLRNGDNLACANEECPGKIVNVFEHFVSKKGLDIKGLSKATLEKLLDWGWIENLSDIFKLQKYAKEWKMQPGFGEKSVNNVLNAIETARTTSTLESFISSLGIPLVGRTMTKELLKHISSYEELREQVNNGFDFSQYPNFGYEKSRSLLDYDYTEADKLYSMMELVVPAEEEKKESLAGLVFCVTGSVKHFKNRVELTKAVEAAGGKVTSSVSKNTSYLVNNDAESTSAKNVTAKKLGIPIISEEKLLEMI